MDAFLETPTAQRVAMLTGTAHRLPHFHAGVELLYVTAGEVVATAGGETACLKQGSVCVSGSYDIHGYAPKEGGEGVVLTFSPEDAASFLARAKGQSVTRHFFQDENLSRTLDAYIALEKDAPEKNALFYAGWAGVVLGLLYDDLALSFEENGARSTMRAVLTYLREHADEPLGLEALSTRFGYGKYYFSVLFHKYTNLNLCKFISAVRAMEVAARLEKGEDVRTASQAAGFASIRTFYRSFTEVYGTTPQKYAARVKTKKTFA